MPIFDHPLIETVYQQLRPCLPTTELWVAYSGGRDSHVLMHALHQLSQQYPELPPRHAIHINHQLYQDSDSWVAHVAREAEALACPLKVVTVEIDPDDASGPEAAARHARYQAFEANLPKGALLLLAHHQHDQAETFLLHALRGSGVAGLGGMPMVRDCGQRRLCRPMLHVSAEIIADYAQQAGLNWIDDPSNAEVDLDRNFIRNQVLPLLATRWPSFETTLARSAVLCQNTQHQLETMLASKLQQHSDGSMVLTCLTSQAAPVQASLLRLWLKAQRVPMPSQAQLDQVLETVVAARPDATPCVQWQGIEVHRFQQRLYVHRPQVIDMDWRAEWDGQSPLELPSNLGRLEATRLGLDISKLDWPVTVRFRKGGERMHPVGRQGSHPLKKLLQEWAVPPWLRDQVPLVFQDEQLICVVGYAVHADWAVNE